MMPNKEILPKGIISTKGRGSYSTDRIGPYSSLTPSSMRTFEVTARHEKLIKVEGVRFAVEDVQPAEKDDMNYPSLGPKELKDKKMSEAKSFYSSPSPYNYEKGYQDFYPMLIEAASTTPDNLVYAGSNAFLHACLISFARHLPLALNPDHIWTMVSFGFAKHVDKHAEELRKNFVQHEGKKRLEVTVNEMIMSEGVEGFGSPAKEWEERVFPNFSSQIKEYIGEDVHSSIVGDFSTTDNVSRAAQEIVLMAAMKNYFSYGMNTCCGIPSITLYGSRDDWVSIRSRTEHLGTLMMPSFSKEWLGKLLPVIDQFIAAYDGKVNHGFWQSMVKLRDTGKGSGSYSFISGWIQLFYPYLESGEVNRHMRPWNEMYFSGPELSEFPPISSSAPVDWEYYGRTYNLHFHAGFSGMSQDSKTGEVMPALGWYVTHDPPQDIKSRLIQVDEEIAALTAGHVGDEKRGPWFERINVLQIEKKRLSCVVNVSDGYATIQALERKSWRNNLSEEEVAQLKRLETEQTEALKLNPEYFLNLSLM